MPVKFPKGFGRRKSTATPFEDGPDEPAVEQSFKVFERADGGSKSFDGGLKFPKSATAPAYGRSRTAHLDNDNMFENVMKNRGSGASNTNTASTTDNSSRLSAASTTPSSTDVPHREDWRSPKERSLEINVPPIPKSTSAFSLKNAGRTLSWGRHKHPSMASPKEPKEPSSPNIDEEQFGRSRAVTASSYASTATPPKLEQNNDLGLSMGGDFSDMFAGFGKRKSVVMDAEANRSMSNSPESLPTGPANRSYTSNNRLMAPSPLSFDRNKQVEPSPYSWSSQHSREGLMSSISPPPFAGRDTPPPPPVPKHTTRANDENQSYSRQQRPETGLRRSSALSARRQSTLEYGDTIDEDARLLRESISASRQLDSPNKNARVRDSWALPSDKLQDVPASSWIYGSTETTPKAKKVEPAVHEDNMFDASFNISANAAQRYQEKPWSTYGKTPKAPTNKVMTPAQFERYKQDQERLRSFGGQSKDDQEDDEEEIYDDDEDEAEKAKAAAKIRRKQEAHMAVYRQQMMKVTGEAPVSRPGVFATQSSPNLTIGGSGSAEDLEEDEEVPLAILQAHGFPNKGKQPAMRSMGSNPNLRAAGSVSGGVLPAGHLPVFARNLPQDPYYGAGLVTPAHRESMAFSVNGAESVNGGPSRGLPPGGLVGVIASEERSRAMRRGSPNPDGTYGQAPSNGYNGMGMHPPPGSMYNGVGPQTPMGPMNPMMMTAGDAAQIQMSQQMSQFMQMQMQFMQMMTTGQGQQQQNGHMAHASMGEVPRAGSVMGGQGMRPGSSSHQRAMTMLEPNAAPWMQQGGGLYAPSIHAQGNGYAPSIAPSERSNIGLPGRYRPVSQAPPLNRPTTMSGALQNWETKNSNATIKAVKKSGNVSDDDDDEDGWAEMAQKREKKKSIWKINKKDKDSNSNGLRDILNYAQS